MDPSIADVPHPGERIAARPADLHGLRDWEERRATAPGARGEGRWRVSAVGARRARRGVSATRCSSSSPAWAADAAATISTCGSRDGRIVGARAAVSRSRRRWFGDGTVPGRDQRRRPARDARSGDRRRGVAPGGATRPLVLLAPDLTTQRAADRDRARRRAAGRGGRRHLRHGGGGHLWPRSDGAARRATLGEIRNRADVIAVLGGGPRRALPAIPRALRRRGVSHPCLARADLVSVSVGADRGPAQADCARRARAGARRWRRWR